ncbi:MAG: hypothetical protein JWP78_1753, partial [Mucilaginibacter sp.]|nr:hypothetical protein [Mucilaginibacter sp.]
KENREIVKRIISTSFIVYIVIALIVVIAGNIFAFFASKIFSVPTPYIQSVYYIISIISVLLGLQLVLRSIASIFFAHQRQFLSNTLSFVLNLSNIAFTVFFVCLSYGLWSFVYSQIIVFVFNTILNIYFFRKYYNYVSIDFKSFDFVLLKQMFSYGFALFLTGVAVQIIFQTDRIIIGSFVSLTAVSIYSFTAKIPELSSQLFWKISDNAFPALVELSKKENAASAIRITHDKIMQLTLSLTTSFFWITLLISYPFINLWVGKQYYSGMGFIALVAYLYLIQLTFIHITSLCLNGFGIAKRISIIALIEAGINLSLSIFFVKWYGIKGVIIATIIGGALTSFWYIPYLAIKHFGANILSYSVSVLKPIIICSVFDLILYIIYKDKFYNINSWTSLIIYTFIISILCLTPVIIINKYLFLELKNKIFSKK